MDVQRNQVYKKASDAYKEVWEDKNIPAFSMRREKAKGFNKRAEKEGVSSYMDETIQNAIEYWPTFIKNKTQDKEKINRTIQKENKIESIKSKGNLIKIAGLIEKEGIVASIDEFNSVIDSWI